MTNPGEGVTFLVNRQIGRHTGPFTTRLDALLALSIVERSGWTPMDSSEFDAYLEEPRS
ncbi:hypothetical protein [Nocardia sp. NBC_01327]|uniref:hypothetical protein n=1 Tax=Nocardia sp. NBC_01327 TaxID=2903593 RepID=UPI002E1627B1|nr:hypothetical protein OG326_23555 [Nocardia sp. NBC_01327]